MRKTQQYSNELWMQKNKARGGRSFISADIVKQEGQNMMLAAMEKAGLTYAQVAEKTGFSEWKVKAIISGAMAVPDKDMDKIDKAIFGVMQNNVDNENHDGTSTIGELLRYGRENYRYSAKEAANLFGISTSMVKGFENGSIYPDLKLLRKMTDRYKIESLKDLTLVSEEEFTSTQAFGNAIMQRRKYLAVPVMMITAATHIPKIPYTAAEAGYIRMDDKDIQKICQYLQTTKENMEESDISSSSVETTGGIFRNLRHASGWPKETAAKEFRMTPENYTAMEKDNLKPSEETIQRLKDVYGLDPELILITGGESSEDKAEELEEDSVEKDFLENGWKALDKNEIVQMIADPDYIPAWDGINTKTKRLKKLLTGQKYAKDKEIIAMLHTLPESKRQAVVFSMFLFASEIGEGHLYKTSESNKGEES